MDTIKEIKQTLESITDFKKESMSCQDVLDEVKILQFLCEKNVKAVNRTLYEKLKKDLGLALKLLSRIRAVHYETGGAYNAVKENYKALVYATLEQIILRVGIEATSSSPVTFITNVTSFILDRVAEYAYVRGAKASENIYFAQASARLWEDLWEIVEKNETIEKLTYGEAKALGDQISHIIQTIEQTKNPEIYIRFYAIIVYIYLLNIVKNINEYEKFGI